MTDSRTMMEYAIVGSIIIGLYIVFLLVRWFLKSRMVSKDTEDSGTAFSLPDLRRMLDQGLLSQDEFDKLKKATIDNVTKSVDGKGK